MSIQSPTASDLSSFVSDQDRKNADLASMARGMPWLPQSDPSWVSDWNRYMTRYAQAREVAGAKLSSAGSSPDDVPAPSEYEALSRAVKIYDAAQSRGDFADLADRVRLAAARGAPGRSPGRLTWSQIRSKLNNAGAVPALPVIEQGGDDVVRALQGFQAASGLPSSGKLTQQTLTYLSAHGEAEKTVDLWKARFGGLPTAAGATSFVSNVMKSDVPKYAAAGAVAALVVKTLGAGVIGTVAAGFGGMALAAYAITHPRSTTA